MVYFGCMTKPNKVAWLTFVVSTILAVVFLTSAVLGSDSYYYDVDDDASKEAGFWAGFAISLFLAVLVLFYFLYFSKASGRYDYKVQFGCTHWKHRFEWVVFALSYAGTITMAVYAPITESGYNFSDSDNKRDMWIVFGCVAFVTCLLAVRCIFFHSRAETSSYTSRPGAYGSRGSRQYAPKVESFSEPQVLSSGQMRSPQISSMSSSSNKQWTNKSVTEFRLAQTGFAALDICVSLATAVINMARRVVANHARCERLSLRIGAMLPLLNALQEHLVSNNRDQQDVRAKSLEPVLQQLQDVLNAAAATIEKWSSREKSIVSLVFSMSKSERYGAKFQELSHDLSDCFNDLNLALQMQMQTFTDGAVVQTQLAKQAFLPSRAEDEDVEDTKQDLKDLAESLTEDGESWESLNKTQRLDLEKQFQTHGLNIKELMRQERRRTIKEKIQDLKISWDEIELSNVVGQGGYGKVYRGHWSAFQVAVKELAQPLLTERMKRMVQQEAYIMSLLRHPNIATFYGLVDEKDHFALVMEFYGRGSLATALEDSNPLPWEWKIAAVSDIARGMAYLHSRPFERVVHGDLKPENVMFNDKGNAVVVDFGVSRVQTYTHTMAPTSGLSLLYAAPEMFTDLQGSREPSIDVYAFGMLMYAVATQSIPFEGVDPRVVSRIVEDGKRPEISSGMKQKHPNYVGLMVSCWAQDPQKRPTFQDISKQLVSMR